MRAAESIAALRTCVHGAWRLCRPGDLSTRADHSYLCVCVVAGLATQAAVRAELEAVRHEQAQAVAKLEAQVGLEQKLYQKLVVLTKGYTALESSHAQLRQQAAESAQELVCAAICLPLLCLACVGEAARHGLLTDRRSHDT
jgi:hypothetical protein